MHKINHKLGSDPVEHHLVNKLFMKRVSEGQIDLVSSVTPPRWPKHALNGGAQCTGFSDADENFYWSWPTSEDGTWMNGDVTPYDFRLRKIASKYFNNSGCIVSMMSTLTCRRDCDCPTGLLQKREHLIVLYIYIYMLLNWLESDQYQT